MYYRRLCKTVEDNGILIPEISDVWDYIKDPTIDHYTSLYLYNKKQFDEFEKTHSVAGVQDVVTDRLLFDFDSKGNLENARADAVKLLARLEEMNINDIEVSFTGNKGYCVVVKLNEYISVKQFKESVFALAKDLPTFDRVVNNPSRIIRVVNTKHQDSGLYKIQLEPNELIMNNTTDILSWAKEPGQTCPIVAYDLPKGLKKLEKAEKPKNPPVTVSTIDFSNKPKFLSNCRWALQNGQFSDGSRSTALLCLASTYKNLGYDLEIVYRMLKGVAELQSTRNASERFPDDEIYNNIILQVFNDTWKNGQYSCREEGNFLHDYCQGLGSNKCDHIHDDQMKPKSLIDVHTSFKDYVKHIDENTIVTGIKAIDDNFFLSTGSNVGIIGAPASGKTALALNILNNTSKNGVKSVFASLDMHRNRMFEKVMYKISGLDRDTLYHKFQMDEEAELMDKLKTEFGNVYFFNKSCPTVQDVRDYILACQETSGEKIKLVMVDYFERVTSDMSDDTAASKRVAGELQDLVNDLDICLITLVQPNKASISSGPDQPIYSYTAIKGSAFVSQAFRQIISIFRPFANPSLKEDDKYMQMAILKNDLGEMGEFVFGWNGKRGEITELEDYQFDEFQSLLRNKESKQSNDRDGF